MKKILLFLFVCSFFLGAKSQESDLLHKYRRMSLDHNYDLKAAQKSILSSMELEQSARADQKAKLSADGSFNYVGNPTKLSIELPTLSSPLDFEGRNIQYGASVSLLQPIYTGGRILESIRMAEHKQSFAVNQKEAVQLAVCFQTDIQYWNAVARAEVTAITEEFRNSIASLSTIIKERVEVGLIDPQDLLMAEVKLNEAEYQLLQAQNNFEIGRMALNSLIGVELTTPTTIDNNIPSEINMNSVTNTAIHPEINMAKDRISMQESSLKLNDSKYKPQFYVGADGGYSSPGYDFKSDLSPNYSVYAKVSIPIFEWGKRKNEKRAYKHSIGMATDNLKKVEEDVTLEIQTARLNLEQASQRVKLTDNSLSKASENEQKAIERYNEGKVSIVDVIDAQVYKQTAQINFVQAKLSMQNSYSDLLRVLNAYNLQ
ncbi:MAG: TolC family protein [Bacteroidaceae bacterium]